MWNIVVIIGLIAATDAPQLLKSREQWVTREACTEALATSLNELRGELDKTIEDKKYLLAGDCFQLKTTDANEQH